MNPPSPKKKQKQFMLHTVKETLQYLRENAVQQCVAMSLCTLIYSKIRRITSVDDMTQIMIASYHNCLPFTMIFFQRIATLHPEI